MTLKRLNISSLDSMMNKTILSTLVLLMSSIVAMSQDKEYLKGEAEYRYDNTTQLWQNTGNSAAIALDSIRNRGIAEIGAMRREGTYHRVQEGSSTNELSLFTERYQSIGKYLYGYGSFRFDYGTTKERAWSDVMRPYESNPFTSGSAVAARYDHQQFVLQARLGTVSLNGWRMGMGIEYMVGDLSRLRDPRTRNRLLDYKVEPGVTYSIGHNTIGLSGFYQRRKEKMPTPTTVQNNPDLTYYQMTGLDALTGTVGGYNGFSREYVSHGFGGEIQYGYNSSQYNTVTSLGIERQSEGIYEQYKREPGHYYSYLYKLETKHRLTKGSVIHHIDASAAYSQAYADQYTPQLVVITDRETGYKSYHYENLLTYKKRWQQNLEKYNLHYRACWTKRKAVVAYAGIEAEQSSLSQKHLMPLSSFDRETLRLKAEYGQALLKHHSLFLTADIGCLIVEKSDLQLSNPENEYTKSVLLKDMEYYDANCLTASLSLKYSWQMKLRRASTRCYVKAWGSTIRANHSLHAETYGITLGVFN